MWEEQEKCYRSRIHSLSRTVIVGHCTCLILTLKHLKHALKQSEDHGSHLLEQLAQTTETTQTLKGYLVHSCYGNCTQKRKFSTD